jgi:SAM-dependent methyltransferase
VSGDRETLRRTFDEEAALYDRARPGYPDALYDDLVELAAAPAGARVLEIGCGTGQATRALARRGFRIVCVELGENLAEFARGRLAEFPEVEIVTGAFESWEPRGATFDMVFAATAWHWVDPAVRYARAAAALAPDGVLAIVATQHVVPVGGDPFFAESQDDYVAAGEAWLDPPQPEDVPDLREEIEQSGLFGEVAVQRYVWGETYDADEYIALLETYSGHRTIEQERREQLYRALRRGIAARPGGRIRKDYLNILHVAKRRPSRSG